MKISFPVFKSLAALSIGTLGLCMSEFSMMGILPEIAAGLGTSIPKAGHFISAYAIGVCAGAPVLAILGRAIQQKKLVLFLMAFFVLGNALTAAASSYGFMMFARFFAGLPHGAYFGVASIIATRLVAPAYSVLAVAIVVFGATVANLMGVPLATFAAWLASWRIAYAFVALIGLLAIIFILLLVPPMPGFRDRGLAREFQFLKSPAPWLIFAAIIMGNGGFFCWYSYVTPYMESVASIPASWITAVMILAGLGMVTGNLGSGKLSRFLADYKLAAYIQLSMALTLFLLWLYGSSAFLALLLMMAGAACLFGLSAPQQMLLLETSPGGQMLGAAMAQVGFNLGNALGASIGGASISQTGGYRETALIATLIALTGFGLLVAYWRFYSRKFMPDKTA